VLIANTFLAYIIGIEELYKIIKEPISDHWAGFTALLIFSGVFYTVFAYFRKQICTVVCPYGRLQGVLLDKNSIVITYDEVRGEPRGKMRKNEVRKIGDCIDCMQCVYMYAPQVLTFAMAHSWNVLTALLALMPATTSWIKLANHAVWCAMPHVTKLSRGAIRMQRSLRNLLFAWQLILPFYWYY
jgi:polyferredoxin